ncbi:MAG: hypothetical protein RLZZ67_546 [Candidatus Parcubacteria bacterium]|jgi:hypothetical protein
MKHFITYTKHMEITAERGLFGVADSQCSNFLCMAEMCS